MIFQILFFCTTVYDFMNLKINISHISNSNPWFCTLLLFFSQHPLIAKAAYWAVHVFIFFFFWDELHPTVVCCFSLIKIKKRILNPFLISYCERRNCKMMRWNITNYWLYWDFQLLGSCFGKYVSGPLRYQVSYARLSI